MFAFFQSRWRDYECSRNAVGQGTLFTHSSSVSIYLSQAFRATLYAINPKLPVTFIDDLSASVSNAIFINRGNPNGLRDSLAALAQDFKALPSGKRL